MTNTHKPFLAIALCAIFCVVVGCWPGFPGWPTDLWPDAAAKPVGLVQLIEFHNIQGLRNWAHELEERGLKSLVFVQKNILEAHSTEIKWLSDAGHEIAGGHAEDAFWDVEYETQFAIMSETKELVEEITGRPMRVFGSRYFAYDENTLAAADALGVEYVLARGTSDVEAIIYVPDEYDCKIISVSNVTFEDMGRGSLCDYSLWARGATAEEFGEALDDAIAKHPKRIMFATHTYLGGMKATWWEQYRRLLDSDEIRWAADFDEWASPESGVNIRVPLRQVPADREVTYTTPTPSEPLDELDDVDWMHNPCGAP